MKPTTSVLEINMCEIAEPEHSVRFSIDEAALKELEINIRENGLLQPILLQTRNGRDKHEIIAGHRRFLACKILKYTTIPATIVDKDEQSRAIMKASENLSRVNLTAIEEAHIYNELAKNNNMSYAEISERFGKTKNIIIDRIQLLRLPQFILDAIHAKKITQSVGREFLNFDDIRTQQYYFNYVIETGANVKTVRNWVSDYKTQKALENNNPNNIDPPTTFLGEMPKQYFQCDGCHGPEEYGNETILRLCRKCMRPDDAESEV
jgi:ParB family transcriptional regulator, chromosome partitioning protein